MMGLRTDTLNTDDLWKEIEEIASFYTSREVQMVSVSFGPPCNTTRIYEPIPVPVKGLLTFIQNCIRQGIYCLGQGELHIQGGEPSMLFILCHVGDIHFESDASGASSEVEQRWSEKGYLLHYYAA